MNQPRTPGHARERHEFPATTHRGTFPGANGAVLSKAANPLVRFCETTFGLAPLNQRDAASNGMSDCFDFRSTAAGATRQCGDRGGTVKSD